MMSNKGVTPITQSTHVRNVKKGDRSKLIFVPLEIIIFTIFYCLQSIHRIHTPKFLQGCCQRDYN